jgi:hypothetical protein
MDHTASGITQIVGPSMLSLFIVLMVTLFSVRKIIGKYVQVIATVSEGFRLRSDESATLAQLGRFMGVKSIFVLYVLHLQSRMLLDPFFPTVV